MWAFPVGCHPVGKKSASACALCQPQKKSHLFQCEVLQRVGMATWIPRASPSPPLSLGFPLLCVTKPFFYRCPAVGLLEWVVFGMKSPWTLLRGHTAALSPSVTGLVTYTKYTCERVIYHKIKRCKMKVIFKIKVDWSLSVFGMGLTLN